MRQSGNFVENQDLSAALRDRLKRSIDKVLKEQKLTQDHRVFFHVFSDRFHGGHFRGMGLTVRDWQNDTERADEVFTTLANTLNSNEDFEVDDTFHVEIVTIPPKSTGRGNRRKLKPGHQKRSMFRKTKQSVIEIKNHDDLCAARAIVVAKAKADNHPQYNSIKQSRGRMQTTMAYRLHQAAGSPATPIGWEGLLQYQAVLPEYRLLVCYEDYGYKVEALSEYTGKSTTTSPVVFPNRKEECERRNHFGRTLRRHYLPQGSSC